MICPCGSEAKFSACCEPIIKGEQKAATAEQLMRARYSAFTKVEVDFLLESMHPDKREGHDPEGVRDWAENSEWHGLEILATEDGTADDDTGTVEFAANYTYNDEDTRYHEVGQFSKEDGNWYFVDGQPAQRQPVVRTEPKIGRNDPCSCGSGKKYKKCCGA